MKKNLHPLSTKIIEYCSKTGEFLDYSINKEKPKKFAAAPATESQLVSAEKQLGTPLDPLHRRLLKEVANGHFGPGYGLYGIPPFSESGCKFFKQDLVKEYTERSKWWWPVGLVPLCYWGCTVISAIYVPDGRIVRYDYSDLNCDYVYAEDTSLERWIDAWISGEEMFDRLNPDPLPRFPETDPVKGW